MTTHFERLNDALLAVVPLEQQKTIAPRLIKAKSENDRLRKAVVGYFQNYECKFQSDDV